MNVNNYVTYSRDHVTHEYSSTDLATVACFRNIACFRNKQMTDRRQTEWRWQ